MQQDNTIAKQTAKTSFWGALEKICSLGIQFVVTMLLARLLTPADYGIIAMIMVFMAISQQFVECGVSNALIRKKDCSPTDYSTAFYFNIIIGFVVYLILFIIAPIISSFYDLPILTPVVRIYGINIVIQSFSLVQNAILIKTLEAKKLAFIAIVSSSIAGVIGIFFAYIGYGVWALVVNTISTSLLTSLLLWTRTRWIPSLIFSWPTMRYLWGFGSKMLLTGIISSTYRNIYSIVIGKFYNIGYVGIFNRGQTLSELFPNIIQSVFIRNSLPIMAEVQSDKERLVHVYREFVKLVSFFTFPAVFLLGVLAKPFILVVLSEKWIDSVPFVQIFCLVNIVVPANVINLNLIQVYGRSDITLKAEIIKKTVGLIAVFSLLPFGLFYLALGSCSMCLLSYVVNLYYAKKLAGISFKTQLLDLSSCFLASCIMVLSVVLVLISFDSALVQLTLGGIIGIAVYYAITRYLYKVTVYEKILDIIPKKVKV